MGDSKVTPFPGLAGTKIVVDTKKSLGPVANVIKLFTAVITSLSA
jgi:hypothetical protein